MVALNMGTRSLTAIKQGNKDSEEICVIYSQFDGYPEGHGLLLKKLLAKLAIVNGLNSANPNVANGMSCLAAQLVTLLKLEHLKTEKRLIKITNKDAKFKVRGDGMAGCYYLEPAGTRDAGEDYLYTLYLVKYPEEQEGERRKALWEKCKAKGDYTKIQNAIFPIGELHMMIQRHDEIIYDGPIKDFVLKEEKGEEE